MSDISATVFVLGAGVNQVIRDRDGLSPPLINNFFQIALKKEKYSNVHYTNKIQIVYEYIKKYWKKNKSALISTPFDLEECFTMIDLQFREAIDTNDIKKARELATVRFRLKSFIAEVLSEFETFAYTSDTMRQFGEILYNEKPIIITFNYDCIIETAIESASGVNPHVSRELFDRNSLQETNVSNEELAYSHYNWNRPLGYSIKFDKVQLHRAGVPIYIEGKRFYSHPKNKLYSWFILKLHGSLNWFRYLPIRAYPTFPGQEEISLPEEKKREIILMDAKYRWWFNEPPDLDGWYIDPIIITPTLYKEEYLRDPLYSRVFSPLWRKAKEVLSNCERLVVIGYSFPATDFPTKKLFLESFSENILGELIVVNPDTSVVQKVKTLCHFEKPVIVCKDLKEFLQLNKKDDRLKLM